MDRKIDTNEVPFYEPSNINQLFHMFGAFMDLLHFVSVVFTCESLWTSNARASRFCPHGTRIGKRKRVAFMEDEVELEYFSLPLLILKY
mmetsp:Transcript_8503/g.17244  ORF Transcript_8503/g.17244 Transcript_8503/m.17244 type:complete len:89 (+) Transcript_8503:94-360(+)